MIHLESTIIYEYGIEACLLLKGKHTHVKSHNKFSINTLLTVRINTVTWQHQGKVIQVVYSHYIDYNVNGG